LKITIMWLVLAIAATGQEVKEAKPEEYVTVPRQFVTPEGLAKAQTTSQQWVGLGKEIGVLTREALGSTVDVAEKFGSTRVGYFVMAMVAWKVLGSDLKRLVIGLPVCCLLLWIWSRSLRRFFFGFQKKQKDGSVFEQPPYKFATLDGRAFCGILHALAAALILLAFFLCLV
jgi:hypothetical protein